MAGRATLLNAEAFVSQTDTQTHASAVVAEAWVVRPTRSPTTITGAGVSQLVAEAWVSNDSPRVDASQVVLEVWIRDTTQSGAGEGAGPAIATSFGYAV